MLKTRESISGSQAAASSQTAQPARSLLFISHANPEDNAAASWFATQLTLMGYDVWCDVKNTHAGESGFWLKVQKKIEDEAAKFIFLLSDTSRNFEKKTGVYKEVQAASNTKRDNFIIPLRIEKLSGSVPIIIGPDIYVASENWAHGLKELLDRLINDAVPKTRAPDYERIKSWWPAVSAQQALVREEPAEVESNIFQFASLPANIHFLSVKSEGNTLSGREQLRGALAAHPPHSAHGVHAISFAQAQDYLELTDRFEIVDDRVLPTAQFLDDGVPELGVLPHTAKNIATYLIAASLERFLADKGLSAKTLSYSNKKIWYPAHGLFSRNNYSYSDPGRRKAPVFFGGTVTSFRKMYAWHFAVQPAVDLRTHNGILFSPKVIISRPYNVARGEKPVPIDDKRVAKKLNWWNDEWRKKLLALAAWLAGGGETIQVPVGYQEIAISARPQIETLARSYLDKDDDEVIREIMSWSDG